MPNYHQCTDSFAAVRSSQNNSNSPKMKGIFGIIVALFLVLIAVASALPRVPNTDHPEEPFILVNRPTQPTPIDEADIF